MKRVLVGIGIVIGAIAVLTAVGVLLFTMTDFGRERSPKWCTGRSESAESVGTCWTAW
jgi:hypothetical protein